METWAYCLMPNHLIVVPETKDGLNLAIGEAHRRNTRRINFHEGWRGHLWQRRFSPFIMEEKYLLACTRYVELNPVRAGLFENNMTAKVAIQKTRITLFAYLAEPRRGVFCHNRTTP